MRLLLPFMNFALVRFACIGEWAVPRPYSNYGSKMAHNSTDYQRIDHIYLQEMVSPISLQK